MNEAQNTGAPAESVASPDADETRVEGGNSSGGEDALTAVPETEDAPPRVLINDVFSSIMDEIDEALAEADDATAKAKAVMADASAASTVARAKTYDALVSAYKLHRLTQSSEDAAERLDALFRERKIKFRKDANRFTRLVRLCFPKRTATDYTRYAWAITFADDWDKSPDAFREELEQDGLTYIAKQTKAVYDCGTGVDDQLDSDGLAVLRAQPARTKIDLPGEDQLVLLMGVRGADGSVDVYYHSALMDEDAAWKLVRSLVQRSEKAASTKANPAEKKKVKEAKE